MKTETEFKYEEALKNLKRKLEELYEEYSNSKEDNPIEHIKYRLKSKDSTKTKLYNKALEYNEENIEKNVSDVVGARIVCSFLSDVKKVITSLKNHPELQVISCKDYITNPKLNGYSSYHMIVRVPVIINEQITYVKAEIQIRTIAMDMWASLDHKIRYKKGIQLAEQTDKVIINSSKECRRLDETLNEKYLTEKNRVKTIQSPKENINWINRAEYMKLMNKYSYALGIVLNKVYYLFNMYNHEEECMKEVNPIEHIKYRLKNKDSIEAKLNSKSLEYTEDNIEKNVNDIAGIRIVCSFESDLVRIIDDLKCGLGLQIVKEKNYVKNPKASGYAGHHLIVSVPVYDLNGLIENIKVEIQVRTIAMDMWASLEHKLCYRKYSDKETKKELLRLAEERRETDKKMEKIIDESRQLITTKRKTKRIHS